MDDRPDRRVMVVTATYNEVDALSRHVARVLALGPGYRMTIVDDGSPDGTGVLADRLAADRAGRIVVVHRPAKAGLATALAAGIGAALLGDDRRIAVMDADGSHDAADLARLVDASEGADMVLGSRYAATGATPGWPRWRRVLSRAGGCYARFVLGLPLTDPTSGFRVMSRSVAEASVAEPLRASGYGVNLELTWRAVRAGARVGETPIVFRERTVGASKLTTGIVAEAMVLVWRLRLDGAIDRRRS